MIEQLLDGHLLCACFVFPSGNLIYVYFLGELVSSKIWLCYSRFILLCFSSKFEYQMAAATSKDDMKAKI